MIIKAQINSEQFEIHTKSYDIQKVVELSPAEFAEFTLNMYDSYDFISEFNAEKHSVSPNTQAAILVLGEHEQDGVLIDSQGYDYARYSAFVPNARQLWQREQYPSLSEFENEMCRLVDKFTQKTIHGQLDCQYRIDFDDVRFRCRNSDFSEQLFMDMLSDRDEIDDIAFLDDGCIVTISDPYLRQEDEQNLRLLSSEEAEIMCAKHILWIHDAGGEQADFSNCLIKDLNLSGKNLINAVFDGAKFVNTDLSKAELCFALFNGTRFQNCNLSDVIAEESEWNNAEYIACNFDKSIFTHSDFKDAKFYDCMMETGSLQNCCLEGTEFGDMDLGSVNMRNCSYDEQAWMAEQLGENISM